MLEMTYAETLVLGVRRIRAIVLALLETAQTDSSHLQSFAVDGGDCGCVLRLPVPEFA